MVNSVLFEQPLFLIMRNCHGNDHNIYTMNKTDGSVTIQIIVLLCLLLYKPDGVCLSLNHKQTTEPDLSERLQLVYSEVSTFLSTFF